MDEAFEFLPMPVFRLADETIPWANEAFKARFPKYNEGVPIRDVLGPVAAYKLEGAAYESSISISCKLRTGRVLIQGFSANGQIFFCLRDPSTPSPDSYAQMAGLANTMREPLASLQLAFERLMLGEFEDQPALAENVMQNFYRLIRLCNNASALAELHQPHRPTDFSDVNVTALCRNILENVRPYLEACEMEIWLDGGQKDIITATNSALLERALYNLIANATIAQTTATGRSASPGGLIRLSLDADRKQVRLSVEDNGPAFDSLALADAWSVLRPPNTAADGPESANPLPRVALGLPLVHTIATELDGQLIIDSREQGAYVTISLPRRVSGRLKSTSPLDYLSGFPLAKLELSVIPVSGAGLYWSPRVQKTRG